MEPNDAYKMSNKMRGLISTDWSTGENILVVWPVIGQPERIFSLSGLWEFATIFGIGVRSRVR
jgi:hypothetical protein